MLLPLLLVFFGSGPSGPQEIGVFQGTVSGGPVMTATVSGGSVFSATISGGAVVTARISGD